MTRIGPLNGVPIACTLTQTAGKSQLEKWRALDEDYALDVARTDTRLTIR